MELIAILGLIAIELVLYIIEQNSKENKKMEEKIYVEPNEIEINEIKKELKEINNKLTLVWAFVIIQIIIFIAGAIIIMYSGATILTAFNYIF